MSDLVIQDSADYARHDFGRFLAEYGLTAEQVRAMSENESDMVDRVERNVQLCLSPIEGRGVFARYDISAGEPVAMARLGDRRTFVGRYTNHSPHPNAEPGFGADSNVYFFAVCDIASGDEVTIDYRKSAELQNIKPTQREVESTLRQKMQRMESGLRQLPQIEVPLRHFFIPGVYAREMFVRKGVLWTGKIHKFQQINIMSKGDMSVMTDQGMVRVQAPFTYVAQAGAKRTGYAWEDSVWTCILDTRGQDLSGTDLEEVERMFVAESEEEYQQFLGQQVLLEGVAA